MRGVDVVKQWQEAERWFAMAERDLRGVGLALKASPPMSRAFTLSGEPHRL